MIDRNRSMKSMVIGRSKLIIDLFSDAVHFIVRFFRFTISNKQILYIIISFLSSGLALLDRFFHIHFLFFYTDFMLQWSTLYCHFDNSKIN